MKYYYYLYLFFLICAGLSCKKGDTEQAVISCIENYGWTDSSHLHPKNAIYTNLLETLTKQGLPGISLMIEDKNGIWYGASGFADIKNNTRMQTCHLGKIASVTKLFTAVMIYKLAEQGSLKLTDPISNYIDDKHIKKIKNAEKATIENLLSHSSGICDIVFDPEFILYTFNNLDKEKSYEKLLEFAYNKKPDFEYNTKHSYNQTLNHVLLAMVLNKALQHDQSIMLRNSIFNPLHMNSSYIRPQESLPWNQIAKGYYDVRKNGILQDLTPLYTGDGKGFTGIYSNVNDLRLFINSLFKYKTLLNTASLSHMTNIDNLDTTLACAGGCRAMQLSVNGQNYTWYGHPGGEVNYAAGAFYSPEANATITYIVNYGVAFEDLGAFTDAYFDFRKKLFIEVCK